MEHSHLIIEPNVTHTHTHTFYDNNVFELLKVYPNLTYYVKTFKFINMFPNIKRTRSQL
jgi:hypothetical protein